MFIGWLDWVGLVGWVGLVLDSDGCVASLLITWKDRSGSGSLLIDGKKSWAIKQWLECTAKAAIGEVLIAMKDAPFQYGPWGEPLSQMKFLFVGSTAPPLATGDADVIPAYDEATITIDWNLPLTEEAQAMLFRRIRLQFERSTAIVDEVQDRRKYRMAEEDLLLLRNLLTLWCQLRVFCSTRLPDFVTFEQGLLTGNHKDAELRELLECRPPSFAMSMLPCCKQAALKEIKQQEENATLEVEKQRLEVREARWKYFCSALERDQQMLLQVQSAPTKLEALRHRKAMAWRLEQSQHGEKIVKAYMQRYLRTEIVDKVEHAQQQVNEYRSFVVSQL